LPKPVHPILVHFPIALLITSFVADGAYFLTSLPTLRDAGFWMLAMACATGALTVVAGLFDMRRAVLDEHVHERVHRHMWVGVGLYVVIAALTAWRWTFYSDPDKFLPMIYLDVGFLAVAMAAFQGWLGGELVFKYGVFVAPKSKDVGTAKGENRAEPKKRSSAPPHHSH
jgi:uncharacterized membrane protein